MKIAIIMGPPGSGKGTLAEIIRERTLYKHVATGDMLREAVQKGTETGAEAETYMKNGELVPDSLMAKLVEERLDSGDADDRYLFDGYPRTDQQARLLEASVEKRGGRIVKAFLLEAERETLISRLCGRRICRQCGKNYHAVNKPPKKDGICDVCGGELYQRPDDTEETIVNRLDVYVEQTESLVARFESRGILERVDSDHDADAAANRIVEVLEFIDNADNTN